MSPTRLCSIADVKTQGNVNASYDYDDEGILRAIEAATVAIFSVTRRDWSLAERNERIPVPRNAVRGTYRLWTAVRPVWLTPVAPKLYLASSFSDQGTLLASSKYEIFAPDGRIDLDPATITSAGDWFIRIRYVGGLGPRDDDPDIYDAPATLVQACAMQAAYMYDRVINSKVGVKQYAGKTGSTTYNALTNGLVQEAHSLVAPFI